METKKISIDSAILSKIEELQSNNNAGIMDILEEIDQITCDLADMSLDDPEASQGKYLSIIQAIRGYRKFFASLTAA